MSEYFMKCNNNYWFYKNIDVDLQYMNCLKVIDHNLDNVLLNWTTLILLLQPELHPTVASIFYDI